MPQEILEDDVDRSLVPVAKRWSISDTLVPGLMLRAGAKTPSWYLRVTRQGTFRVVLGHPRSMSLPVARAIARKAITDHLAGVRINDDWIRAEHRSHGVRTVPEPRPVYIEPSGPWTWEEAAEAYLHSLAVRGRSPVTVAQNRKALLHVLTRFVGRPVGDVDVEDVQEAVDEIADTTPALAELALKSARPFAHWLGTSGRSEKSGMRGHPYRSLMMPPLELRKPRSFASVSIGSVARLVAMARVGVLADSVARALEFIVLTGLPRSEVCPTRHDDVEDGLLTVRPELLRRRDPIRVPLTPHLRRLLRSDHDVWCFPQPRKAYRTRHRSFTRPEALGRATWEIPSVPTATEAHLAMREWLQRHYAPNDRIGLLTDSGGADDARDEDGVATWEHRGRMIADWCEVVLPLVDAEIARIDVEAVKKAMREKRPNQD